MGGGRQPRGARAHTVLYGAGLLLALLLAGFGTAIALSQHQARERLQTVAHQRTVLVAGLIDAAFRQTAHVGPEALADLGTPLVGDAELQALRGQDDYVALLDTSGDVLAHSSGWTAQARHAVLTGQARRLTVAGDAWALGNRFAYGRSGVINLAARISTPAGERILVTGLPSATLARLLGSEFGRVPGPARQHQLMLDGHGTVIGSSVPDRPAGYVFHSPGQLGALNRAEGVERGVNGVRWFDTVALADTTWRLIVSVPESEFFASVVGWHHTLPWLVLLALGVMGAIVLSLVDRSQRAGERIRVANARLTRSNDELAGAREALQDANLALARSNTELESRARELVRSNAELDQFAQVASHDLQEPLRKVRTFTERVTATEADRLSERGADYLRRADAAAERMQGLIEDLLRYSRVTTRGRPFAPVDLAALTAAVLEDLAEPIERAGAHLDVGPLPVIAADEPQIRQLVQNLVSNALKFRREGATPHVVIRAEAHGGWLTLTVADDGIGFEERYAERIFRVFERLHGRGSYPGTGIGLALCRKIAERHGGTVRASAAPGRGATFTVTLQTERTEAVDALAPPAPPDPLGDRDASGSPTRPDPLQERHVHA